MASQTMIQIALKGCTIHAIAEHILLLVDPGLKLGFESFFYHKDAFNSLPLLLLIVVHSRR